VGLRTGLDAVAKRKKPTPCQESNPELPARSLVTILTALQRVVGSCDYQIRSKLGLLVVPQ
jgi:hypothetical protein